MAYLQHPRVQREYHGQWPGMLPCKSESPAARNEADLLVVSRPPASEARMRSDIPFIIHVCSMFDKLG